MANRKIIAALGILTLFNVSAASAADPAAGKLTQVMPPPPVAPAASEAALLNALGQQSQVMSGMQQVMVQQMIAQQDNNATLREINAVLLQIQATLAAKGK